MTNIPNNTALWASSSSSDVTLICEGKSFRCHRHILVQSSDYFRALLLGSFIEGKSATVELFEDDPDALERLLRSLYGFPLESAMENYYTFPGVAAYMDDESETCPITRGEALVPWLTRTVGLYVAARKYLCDGICTQLTGPNYCEWALEGLFWDFAMAGEASRPDVELVRALVGPVYDYVPNSRDALRCQIADMVAYYQRQEMHRQTMYEPGLELRFPELLAALPDLQTDLETCTPRDDSNMLL